MCAKVPGEAPDLSILTACSTQSKSCTSLSPSNMIRRRFVHHVGNDVLLEGQRVLGGDNLRTCFTIVLRILDPTPDATSSCGYKVLNGRCSQCSRTYAAHNCAQQYNVQKATQNTSALRKFYSMRTCFITPYHVACAQAICKQPSPIGDH